LSFFYTFPSSGFKKKQRNNSLKSHLNTDFQLNIFAFQKNTRVTSSAKTAISSDKVAIFADKRDSLAVRRDSSPNKKENLSVQEAISRYSEDSSKSLEATYPNRKAISEEIGESFQNFRGSYTITRGYA